MARGGSKDLRAIGITCGIGSMLVGARHAGFDVVGNIEWRKYYHCVDERGRNTFLQNFPGALFPLSLDHMTPDEIERFMGVELALGHPECGNFSQLSGANANRKQAAMDPADIPLFVDMVARLKPRYFAMDDLPKSLLAYPMVKYAEKLKDYDLYPEWVSNWGYGNVQKGRNRMFMVGALKKEKWAFSAGEFEHQTKVKDVLGDLPEPRRGANVPNHDPYDLERDCARALNLHEYRRKHSWGAVKEYFKDKPGGHTLELTLRADMQEDRIKRGLPPNSKRIGFLKGHWDGPSHVLTGGNATFHGVRCEPYTVRERARIQGFPDDFIFYGTKLNERGEWDHDVNRETMVKQTGKAMPVQFCQYFSEQVAARISGRRFISSGKRVIPANEHVDQAKQWYCQNVGYADQEAACSACWMREKCKIRVQKYGLGPQMDLFIRPKKHRRR